MSPFLFGDRQIAMIVALTLSAAAACPANAQHSSNSELALSCEVGGDADACMETAIRSYEGDQTAKDDAAARKFAALACDAGQLEGCNMLGSFFENGIAGQKDRIVAETLYRRACVGKVRAGCFNLAQLLHSHSGARTEVFPEARVAFASACAAGMANACNNHAVMLKLGEGGAQDLIGARGGFEKGCAGGDNDACANYGFMLVAGEGGDIDGPKAAALLEPACDAGSGFACDNMGVVLLRALAGKRQPARAQSFFARACELGEANGCFNKAEMLFHGVAGAPDLAAARAAYAAACTGGIGSACGSLARMLNLGTGGPRDPAGARQLFGDLCATGSNPQDCIMYSVLTELGQGGPQDRNASNLALEKACALGSDMACEAREQRRTP